MLDAVVIGGGFYGVYIATYLARKRGLKKVLLVEQENQLLTRASYNNQARIHNGYHYPRSYITAHRSRINLPRFLDDFPAAVCGDFVKLYAVARRNSKVNAHQFIRFCNEIGARIEPAPAQYAQMFDPQLIEAAFLVEEYAFNAAELAAWAMKTLSSSGIEVRLGHRVRACRLASNGTTVDITSAPEQIENIESLTARYVFNCTYSGLNQFGDGFTPTTTKLKHEITEMGLLEMPSSLRGLGITVMDGPFFSVMPFPARGLHSISHVRYTPHKYWYDNSGDDPYQRLKHYDKESRVDRMIRDATRYMPGLNAATYRDSLFEVKTVLHKHETDDGRPILFEKSKDLPGFYFVLGGKIDNIYDIVRFLDKETFERAPT